MVFYLLANTQNNLTDKQVIKVFHVIKNYKDTFSATIDDLQSIDDIELNELNELNKIITTLTETNINIVFYRRQCQSLCYTEIGQLISDNHNNPEALRQEVLNNKHKIKQFVTNIVFNNKKPITDVERLFDLPNWDESDFLLQVFIFIKIGELLGMEVKDTESLTKLFTEFDKFNELPKKEEVNDLDIYSEFYNTIKEFIYLIMGPHYMLILQQSIFNNASDIAEDIYDFQDAVNTPEVKDCIANIQNHSINMFNSIAQCTSPLSEYSQFQLAMNMVQEPNMLLDSNLLEKKSMELLLEDKKHKNNVNNKKYDQKIKKANKEIEELKKNDPQDINEINNIQNEIIKIETEKKNTEIQLENQFINDQNTISYNIQKHQQAKDEIQQTYNETKKKIKNKAALNNGEISALSRQELPGKDVIDTVIDRALKDFIIPTIEKIPINNYVYCMLLNLSIIEKPQSLQLGTKLKYKYDKEHINACTRKTIDTSRYSLFSGLTNRYFNNSSFPTEYNDNMSTQDKSHIDPMTNMTLDLMGVSSYFGDSKLITPGRNIGSIVNSFYNIGGLYNTSLEPVNKLSQKNYNFLSPQVEITDIGLHLYLITHYLYSHCNNDSIKEMYNQVKEISMLFDQMETVKYNNKQYFTHINETDFLNKLRDVISDIKSYYSLSNNITKSSITNIDSLQTVLCNLTKELKICKNDFATKKNIFFLRKNFIYNMSKDANSVNIIKHDNHYETALVDEAKIQQYEDINQYKKTPPNCSVPVKYSNIINLLTNLDLQEEITVGDNTKASMSYFVQDIYQLKDLKNERELKQLIFSCFPAGLAHFILNNRYVGSFYDYISDDVKHQLESSTLFQLANHIKNFIQDGFYKNRHVISSTCIKIFEKNQKKHMLNTIYTPNLPNVITSVNDLKNSKLINFNSLLSKLKINLNTQDDNHKLVNALLQMSVIPCQLKSNCYSLFAHPYLNLIEFKSKVKDVAISEPNVSNQLHIIFHESVPKSEQQSLSEQVKKKVTSQVKELYLNSLLFVAAMSLKGDTTGCVSNIFFDNEIESDFTMVRNALNSKNIKKQLCFTNSTAGGLQKKFSSTLPIDQDGIQATYIKEMSNIVNKNKLKQTMEQEQDLTLTLDKLLVSTITKKTRNTSEQIKKFLSFSCDYPWNKMIKSNENIDEAMGDTMNNITNSPLHVVSEYWKNDVLNTCCPLSRDAIKIKEMFREEYTTQPITYIDQKEIFLLETYIRKERTKEQLKFIQQGDEEGLFMPGTDHHVLSKILVQQLHQSDDACAKTFERFTTIFFTDTVNKISQLCTTQQNVIHHSITDRFKYILGQTNISKKCQEDIFSSFSKEFLFIDNNKIQHLEKIELLLKTGKIKEIYEYFDSILPVESMVDIDKNGLYCMLLCDLVVFYLCISQEKYEYPIEPQAIYSQIVRQLFTNVGKSSELSLLSSMCFLDTVVTQLTEPPEYVELQSHNQILSSFANKDVYVDMYNNLDIVNKDSNYYKEFNHTKRDIHNHKYNKKNNYTDKEDLHKYFNYFIVACTTSLLDSILYNAIYKKNNKKSEMEKISNEINELETEDHTNQENTKEDNVKTHNQQKNNTNNPSTTEKTENTTATSTS